MCKKTYLSFRFITSRPLCQIKRGDQTGVLITEWRIRLVRFYWETWSTKSFYISPRWHVVIVDSWDFVGDIESRLFSLTDMLWQRAFRAVAISLHVVKTCEVRWELQNSCQLLVLLFVIVGDGFGNQSNLMVRLFTLANLPVQFRHKNNASSFSPCI